VGFVQSHLNWVSFIKALIIIEKKKKIGCEFLKVVPFKMKRS
jgi:hypothetical protein